ncbi:MAG: phosphoglycolate phosphatase [Gammaproteobacteria bacterium]|nr:phosphoglycolate phosphatase [Gammaproteobacteria bacterium]
MARLADLSRYRTWLLDLDGTLVDSAPDLHGALEATLHRHGHDTVSEQLVRKFVGAGARVLIERALAAIYPQADAQQAALAHIDELHAHFLEYYAGHIADRSQPYPGVRETLVALGQRGIALAVVTNKYEGLSRQLLEALDLSGHFGAVVGGDTLPVRKPDPGPLLEACRQLGSDPAQTVMVGDSITDIRAARNADMPVICVSYGYNHGEDIHSAGADRVVDSLQGLI